MTEANSIIAALTDSKAIEILKTITQAHCETSSDMPATNALSDAWQVDQTADTPADASEGALARITLQWLADEDPTQKQAIHAMAQQQSPMRFAMGLSIGSVLAVLLLLKTQGKVEYKNGKWHLKVELVELKQGPLKTVFALLSKMQLGK